MTNSTAAPEHDAGPLWYTVKDGIKRGPISALQLRHLAQTGALFPDDLVWTAGMPDWQKAGHTAGVLEPPPAPTAAVASVPNAPAADAAPTAKTLQPTPAVSLARGNYFIRHWRGELPLWQSYWLNGALVGIASATVAAMLASINVQPHPMLYSVAAIGVLLVAYPVATLWQIVGIWRSAGNHVARGGRAGWASAAQVMAVLGAVSFAGQFTTTALPASEEYWKIATGTDAMNKYQLRVLRDATELEIAGNIGFGLTDKVRAELDAHPTITTVHLNSLGGRVLEARALARLIEDRKLTTYTATGCASACTLAYVAGTRRLIDPSARLGFHQYSFPGISNTDFASAYAEDKAYLRSRGVDRAFIDKAYSFAAKDIWTPTQAELYAAHVITAEAGSNEVALSGVSPTELSSADVDVGLTKSLIYATLKETDPDVYAAIVTHMKEALLKGRSIAEVRAKTTPELLKLRDERLPYASDEAAVAFATMQRDEWQVLSTVSSDLCFGYAMGNVAVMEKAIAALPPALRDHETDVLAQVIRTGKSHTFQPASDAVGAARISEAVQTLRRQYGDDVRVLGEIANPDVDHAKACAMLIALYSELVSGRATQAGPVLRYVAKK